MDESLEGVFVNQLPNMVEETLDEGLTQTGITVTETAESIGDTAIDEELERVLELIVRGQIELIDELGYDSNEERIRTRAIDTSGDLMKEAAESRLWNVSAIGTRLLGWISAASVMNRGSRDRGNNRYTSLLILYFPKLLYKVKESGEQPTDYQTTAWLRNETQDVHPVDLLVSSCYDSMAELTSAAIRIAH